MPIRTAVLLLLLAGPAVPALGDDPPAPSDGGRRIPYATFLDRLRGGWAGQMAGVSYGSIYEFKANGVPIDGPLREWKPEYVANALGQDDIYVEMTFLKVLEEHGLEPTPGQVGAAFRDSGYDLWHANMAARTNLKAGLLPPDSGHPRFNPHSDDIDFQIEADLFGLVAPGMPNEAVRLAEPFGRVMNHGDGLYGGLFLAALYSYAFTEPEATPGAMVRVVESALAHIPAESGYAKLIRDVLTTYHEDPEDWRGRLEHDRAPLRPGRPLPRRQERRLQHRRQGQRRLRRHRPALRPRQLRAHARDQHPMRPGRRLQPGVGRRRAGHDPGPLPHPPAVRRRDRRPEGQAVRVHRV